MNIRLLHLDVRTRKTTERVPFSQTVTFIYGPVSTGKSTVARLVDYCFGGGLERTPAIQREFVSAALSVVLGESTCTLERGAADTQSVRVTWSNGTEEESVNAPLEAQDARLVDKAEVYNLSDLIFYLCGVNPIKGTATGQGSRIADGAPKHPRRLAGTATWSRHTSIRHSLIWRTSFAAARVKTRSASLPDCIRSD